MYELDTFISSKNYQTDIFSTVNIFSAIASILNKPFPEDENFGQQLKNISIVSVFVLLFLFIFQPFGISDVKERKFALILGFGLVTFFSMLLYTLLFNLIIKLKGSRGQWTYGKWILYNLGIMVVISLANFLFSRLWYFGYIIWSLYPQMMYSTLMIGIIPISAIGAISLNRHEKKYKKIASQINQNTATKKIQSNIPSKSIFGIEVSHIRYIEALQNYVKIGFIDAQGILKFKTERSTLKSIEEELGEGTITKCHRSFLVNKDAIVSTDGNAQGLLLTLEGCDIQVPVSRSLVPQFRV